MGCVLTPPPPPSRCLFPPPPRLDVLLHLGIAFVCLLSFAILSRQDSHPHSQHVLYPPGEAGGDGKGTGTVRRFCFVLVGRVPSFAPRLAFLFLVGLFSFFLFAFHPCCLLGVLRCLVVARLKASYPGFPWALSVNDVDSAQGRHVVLLQYAPTRHLPIYGYLWLLRHKGIPWVLAVLYAYGH